MGIAQKVARNFSDAVRSRGQSYFSKGRVTMMSAKPNEVVAKVRGTTKYRVRVRLRGAKLLTSCTCPYFSPQGEPCKHLWATLLLADSRGLLQTAPSFVVRLVPEPARRGPASEGIPRGDTHPEVETAPTVESKLTGMHMGGERLPGPSSRSLRPRSGKERPNRHQSTTSGTGGSTWSPIDTTGRRVLGRGKARTSPGQGGTQAKPVNRNAKRLLVYDLD